MNRYIGMRKQDILILIVEDDPTLGKAIQEGLGKVGYKTHWVKKPDEAIQYAQFNQPIGFVIDCMLPKMNGVDLAKKLQLQNIDHACLVMTSGIYKDKAFIKNTSKNLPVSAFLVKPFDLKDLIKVFDDHFTPAEEVSTSPLHNLYISPRLTERQKVKAINNSENVHGYDLLWIFMLLAEEEISGNLNIMTPEGDVLGVGFLDGEIVNVNLKDTQSYFGLLLVERGFISAHELEETLSQTNKTKRIGEQLVDANLLSPHAIDIVVAEQLGIRLSKIVMDSSLTVNFSKGDEIQVEARFSKNQLLEFTSHLLDSKVSLEWLKSHYLPWVRNSITKGPNFSHTHPCLHISPLSRLPNFLEFITSGINIEQALDSGNYDERSFYQAVHMLLINRMLLFEAQAKSIDFTLHKKRLMQIESELANKNYFEKLGLSQNAKEPEIKRAYRELAKALHPDKLDSSTPPDVLQLSKRVFDQIQEAYDTLQNAQKRTSYLKELETGRAESVLRAESLTERGKTALNRGEWRQALDHLTAAVKLCPPTSELKLLLIWAQIKSTKSKKGEDSDLADISKRLYEIPPEDKHTSLFYFVKGLVQKESADMEEALKSFKHSLHLDPGFISARREQSMLRSEEQSKTVDLLRGDLRDVVGALFKRRK